jgi:hypothetical protein
MKNAIKSNALSGFKKPHKNSLPGPVREIENRMTDAVMNPLANVFILIRRFNV